jgi:hypothetical protein
MDKCRLTRRVWVRRRPCRRQVARARRDVLSLLASRRRSQGVGPTCCRRSGAPNLTTVGTPCPNHERQVYIGDIGSWQDTDALRGPTASATPSTAVLVRLCRVPTGGCAVRTLRPRPRAAAARRRRRRPARCRRSQAANAYALGLVDHATCVHSIRAPRTKMEVALIVCQRTLQL